MGGALRKLLRANRERRPATRERRAPSMTSVYDEPYMTPEPYSLFEWEAELWVYVRSDRWSRVNDLLARYPTYHCKNLLLWAAQVPLSGTPRDETVMSVFRTLLERCANDSRERNVVINVAHTIVHFGRLEQLRELLTTDMPAVRRDLWDHAHNLRKLRGLLVHFVCTSAPNANEFDFALTQVKGDHSACLTLACQKGVFAAPLDAADSDSSNFGRLGSPLYKAVFYNRPDAVRFLYEVGAVSRREMLELLPLAMKNAYNQSTTMTPAQRIEASANELVLCDQSLMAPEDSFEDIEFQNSHVSAAWDVLDLLKTADNPIRTVGDLRYFIGSASMDERRARVLAMMYVVEQFAWFNLKYQHPRTDEYRVAGKKIVDFLKTHASQPRSLQNQCLLTLSRKAGVGRDEEGHDRLTRIQRLRLPSSFQKVMSFEDPVLKAQ